jgi:hypothetical protein
LAGALREILAKFGFEVDTKKLDAAKEKTDGFAGQVRNMAGVLLGAQLIGAVRGFVGELIDVGSQLNDTSAQLGISTGDLQRWQFVAGAAGVDAGTLAQSFKFLQKNAVDAAGGGKETGEAFKALGVNVKDANGNVKDTSPLMREAGLALAAIKNPAERNALALKAFGKAGVQLGPAFANGAEGLDAMLKRFDELGGGLSEDAIKMLDDAGDKSDELSLSWLSLKSRLAVDLFPYINKAIDFFIKLSGQFSAGAKNSNVFKAALIVLGTAGALAGLKMMAPYIPFALMMALLVLVVDDLITAFQGGDSVIGRVLDKILGKGAGASIFKSIREDWDALNKALAGKSGADAAAEAFSVAGASIVRFLVEDIPAAIDVAFGAGTWSKVTTGIMNGLNPIPAMLKGFWATFLAGLTFGQDLVNGIINGIKDATAGVSDAMGGVADAIKAKLQAAFTFGSPSKVMTDRGEDIDMGLVQGLAKGAPAIEAQAADTFASAMFPDQDIPTIGARGGRGGGGAGMVSQPQITIQINAPGGDPAAVSAAAQDGVRRGLLDADRATLASLEDLAEA